MLDLSHKKLLTYDSTLGHIVLYGFTGDFTNSPDNLYYLKADNPRLTDIQGTYIKLQPLIFYYETDQGRAWRAFTAADAGKIKASSVIMVRFKIVGIYHSLERLNSKSKLKGFSRVIDDNNYFSAIPLINELVHWDNGVLVSSEHRLTTVYGDSWDNFNISLAVSYDGTKRVKMTGGAGHIHL